MLTKGGVDLPETGIKDVWSYANNVIRSTRQMVNEGLKPLGLGSSEGNILLHLFTRQEEVRQENLVEDLDISKPAVSRALKSLERKDYVKRNKDAADKRASRIMLTEKAMEIRPKIESVYNEVYSTAAQGISEEEADFFIKLFSRVSENISLARSEMKNQGRQNDYK